MNDAATLQPWQIYVTKTLFIITETNTSSDPSRELDFLGISRESGVAQEGKDTYRGFQEKLQKLGGAAGAPRPQACAAVLGCLTTHRESFLLVASAASLVAQFDDQRVFEVARCAALQFSTSDLSAETTAAVADVKQLLGKGFYLSRDFDITRRLQCRLLAAPGPPENFMLAADDRFVWNRQLAEPFLVQEGVSARWFTPIMQGFVQLRTFAGAHVGNLIPGTSLLLLLIARRSRRRAGTRFNARGLDDDGEAGNWVETEHLVKLSRAPGCPLCPEGWISLVQLRGSAPVFWEQSSALKKITVTRGAQLGQVAFQKHHTWITAEYGDVLYVNLLSEAPAKRETEGVLKKALENQLKMHADIKWKHLDFHAHVSGEEQVFDQELDKLARHVAEVAGDFGHLDATGQLDRSSGGGLRRLQKGIIRTNCFDCLDRTNILQQQVVWQWLAAYLSAPEYGLGSLTQRNKAGVASKHPAGAGSVGPGGLGNLFAAFGEMLSDAPGGDTRPPLQSLVREMWADLGDALSEQYTGTASTMGAALRQGGQTTLAMLEKGWLSVNRAYCAHFADGARQAALDLLLGKHRLPRAPGAPEVRRAPCGSLTVAVVTWNLHGRACWEAPDCLRVLLHGLCGHAAAERPTDVILFCFQEMMPLTAANVVMQGDGDEARQSEFEAAALLAIPSVLGEPFVKVRGIGMVGLYLGAFVARRLQDSVAGVLANRTAVGLYGQAGNKGAVGVRFEVAKTSICALSVHLESGKGKAAERAAQLREVLQASLSAGGPARAPLAVTKHDLVVLAGDFNFRLALPQGVDEEPLRETFSDSWPEARSGCEPDCEAGCVGEGPASARAAPAALKSFASYDELRGERAAPAAAEALREAGLVEGPVLFPPTYRLLEGARRYDAERAPAWCDRVLHSKVGVVRRRYCALANLTQSDHRPVCAVLETNLLALPKSRCEPARAQPQALERDALAGEQTLSTARTTECNGMADATIPCSRSASEGPRTQTASSSSNLVDLLDARPPLADLGPATPPQSTPSPAFHGEAPGRPLPSEGILPGQLVLAEHAGGWFYATVHRVGGGTCDVAWRRPQGANWGRDSTNARYLCSTGADETQHGQKIPLSNRVRLPEGSHSPASLSKDSDTPRRALSAATVDLLA